jgi:hypothetical protein
MGKTSRSLAHEYHPAQMKLVIFALALIASLPAAAMTPCGPVPEPPTCGHWQCSGTTWKEVFSLIGTSCTTSSDYPGLCDDVGNCSNGVRLLLHGVPVAVLYVPPGRLSSVAYGAGNTSGMAITNAYTTGTADQGQVGARIFGIGVGTQSNYQTGTTATNVFRLTKTTASTLTASNPGQTDFLDHSYDQVLIWTNPLNEVWILDSGRIVGQSWWTSDAQSAAVTPFQIRELNGTVAINNQYKQVLFNAFTNKDKTAFLATDPYSSGSPALGGNRFQKVAKGVAVYGPDHPSDQVFTWTYNVAYNRANDSTFASYVNSQNAVLLTIGLDISVIGNVFNFNASGTIDSTVTNYLDSRTNSTGDQQTAQLSLKTTSVGCTIINDVYIDAAFNTYLVVPTSWLGPCG